MNTLFGRLGILGALLALALSGVAQQPLNGPKTTKTYPLSGSLYGTLSPLGDGTMGWVGYAYIRFGDQAPRLATFVDRNNWGGVRPNGGVFGSETITFTFADGSGTFAVRVNYHAAPASTPNMFTVEEHGPIGNGTGRYALAGGMLTTRGHAIIPDFGFTIPWMAELHGSISGVED